MRNFDSRQHLERAPEEEAESFACLLFVSLLCWLGSERHRLFAPRCVVVARGCIICAQVASWNVIVTSSELKGRSDNARARAPRRKYRRLASIGRPAREG